jgi:hypothetical protein
MRAVYLVLINTEAAAAITIPDRLRHAGYRGGQNDTLCDVDVGGVRGEVSSRRRTVVRNGHCRNDVMTGYMYRPRVIPSSTARLSGQGK